MLFLTVCFAVVLLALLIVKYCFSWEQEDTPLEHFKGPRKWQEKILKDIANTARVVARFGPRLPNLVENTLLTQSEKQEKKIYSM